MIKKNGGIFGRNPTYNDVVVEGVLTLKEAQVFDNDITINGDLTVNGTETVINTVELNVDDKNITMGAVVAKVGLTSASNITIGQFTVLIADTAGLVPGMTVTKTAGTGAFAAGAKIASVDSHYQITLDLAHTASGSITFDTGGATDFTADGGGITLKGTTDKFIKWVKANVAWVFSDPIKTPDVTVDNLTASKPVFTDANKKLTSTGTLAIDQGGTGQTTQQAAINALAGAVTAAKFLRGDGTNVSMSAIQASDVPTLNQSTTGNADTATTANNLKSNATTGLFQITGPAAGSTRVMTVPDASFVVARTDGSSPQTFTPAQVFAGGFQVNGAYALSASAGPGTWSYEYPVTRIFPGDGTGYSLAFSKRNSSVTTDLITIADNTGNMTLNTGNLVIGTSGKGIDFSATSQASGMTSELLADYEEGTWSPGLSPATGSFTTLTFASANGYYRKVGNMVYVCGYFWTVGAITVGTASGQLRITGLPYTVGANEAVGGAWTNPDSGNYNQPLALCTGVRASGTALYMHKNGTVNNPAFNAADLNASGGNANYIGFTCTYQV